MCGSENDLASLEISYHPHHDNLDAKKMPVYLDSPSAYTRLSLSL